MKYYCLNSEEQVTKRVETDEKEWSDWNWRTDGDMLVNGAFFVPSGEGLSAQYAKASSVEPKASGLIDQLTMNAGCLGGPRDNSVSVSYNGGSTTADSANGYGGARSSGGDGDFFGMIFGSDAPPPPTSSMAIFLSLLIIIILYMTTSQGALLSLPL